MKFVAFLLLLSYPSYAIHIKSDKIDITTNKVIHLGDVVIGPKLDATVKEALDTGPLSGDRAIVINSNGGSVDLGATFIKAMAEEKIEGGGRIVCVVTGMAHSMAFNILTFCDVRLATKGSKMLVHKVRALVPRVLLTAAELRTIADGIDKTDAPYRKANAAAMHLTLKEYDTAADSERVWTAEELLKLKYIQDIVTVQDSQFDIQ